MFSEFKKIKFSNNFIFSRPKFIIKKQNDSLYETIFNSIFSNSQREIIRSLEKIYQKHFDVWRKENCEAFREEIDRCMKVRVSLETNHANLLLHKETYIEYIHNNDDFPYETQTMIHDKLDFINSKIRYIEEKIHDINDRIQSITSYYISSIYYPLITQVLKLILSCAKHISIEQGLIFAYQFGNFYFPEEFSLFECDFEKKSFDYIYSNILLHPLIVSIEQKYITKISSTSRHEACQEVFMSMEVHHSKEQCVFYLRAYDLFMHFPYIEIDHNHLLFLNNGALVFYMLRFLFPELKKEDCKTFNLVI